MNLDDDIQYIKGIGQKKAIGFAKLGVKKAQDLLLFFPVQYQDRTKISEIGNIAFNSQVCIFGKIGEVFQRQLSMSLFLMEIEIFDRSGTICVRFFRKKSPYARFDPFGAIKKDFQTGKFAYVFGDAKWDLRSKYISVNDYEIVENENDCPNAFKKILPVYSGTENISQKHIREAVKTTVEMFKDSYPDISDLITPFKGLEKIKSPQAIEQIHYPKTLEDGEKARRAFALQEFIIFETALAISRHENKVSTKEQKYEIKRNLLTPFRENLNFEFTKAQKRCINEIFDDMKKDFPMNRMLMGDVGSGKTVVALSAILLAVENGYQSMIIAPTEILAQQHFNAIEKMLE
ncbi:MAG: DEAD/DEAH box helicase, partial [Elusimicrobiota bacterium]|nr:DEAD/DEAH box helicase [Elusimicrobiota bacterium]